jgi:hypothetical protein
MSLVRVDTCWIYGYKVIGFLDAKTDSMGLLKFMAVLRCYGFHITLQEMSGYLDMTFYYAKMQER